MDIPQKTFPPFSFKLLVIIRVFLKMNTDILIRYLTFERLLYKFLVSENPEVNMNSRRLAL
jgi:hypothetical protein